MIHRRCPVVCPVTRIGNRANHEAAGMGGVMDPLEREHLSGSDQIVDIVIFAFKKKNPPRFQLNTYA